ncbi:MAG: hypothetical protein ABWX83_09525 [Luteibacter sp.]
MATDTNAPQPSPETREAMSRAYNAAAATNREACDTHVIDEAGKCCAVLTETQKTRRAQAKLPSGNLPPPM